MAKESKGGTVSYTVSFCEEDNAYITDRAEKRGKTPEEQIQDSAVGKGGNKRKKDMDTQRELTNVTGLLNTLQGKILEQKPYTELLGLTESIGKEVVMICQL